MLTFISGDSCSMKTEMLIDKISVSVKSGRKLYVFVPDQFSFEYDKKLYKALGASLFNSIPVLSFIKVSEAIIKQYGTRKGEYADEYTKQIMMFKALKCLRRADECKYYKRQLDKPAFVSTSLDAVKEFSQSSVTPDMLIDAADSLDGNLSSKIRAVGNIYKKYCENLSDNYLKDSLTIISEAADIALNNRHFSGCDVFVDGFEGFTADELSMMRTIISSADNVSVCLTIGNGNNAKTKISPFVNSVLTQKKLVDIAKEFNKPVDFISAVQSEGKCPSIRYISSNIFNPIKNRADASDGVRVISADDIYEESDYVSAEIRHLVCDKGYRFSDIAVVTRQMSDYSNVLSGSFERYEIPYFTDERQSISQKSLVLYINSIFECIITKKYNTENILRLIKSSLCLLGDAKISHIEDYCYEWGVNGDMWLSDFTAVREKDKSRKFKDDITYLEYINEIRSIIISPLEEFKTSCKNKNVKEICKAFYNLFDRLKVNFAVSHTISNASVEYGEDNAEVIEISRDFKQLWQTIHNIIRAIYDNLGDEKLSVKEFYEVFSVLISKATVSLPPQKLDAVILASASRSRLPENIRATFVMGVNEGIMPMTVHDDGLLTEKEKDRLSKAGIEVSQSAMWKIAAERFLSYTALTSPREKLYLSYSLSDLTGNQRRPSSVIRQCISMFGNDIYLQANALSPAYYCMTKHSAYYKYLENKKDMTSDIASIRKALYDDKEYREKLEKINGIVEKPVHSLSSEKSGLLFENNEIYLSATKIEKFSRCPFSYFCQYGLKIYPVKSAEMNAVNAGNVVHYCLEKIMSVESGDAVEIYDSRFTDLSSDEIKAKIKECLEKYKNTELGGDFGKTKRFEFMYNNLLSMTYEIVLNIQKEFRQSDYRPKSFEYSLTDGEHSVLEMRIDDKITVKISGKIDRVDTFEKDGKQYIRIVDYKTGTKELKFENLYNGINLQMLLYLSALCDGKSHYNGYIPAGILYMPAVYVDATIDRQSDRSVIEAKIESAKLSAFRMNGIIVDIADSYNAMEKELKGKLIKIRQDKSNIMPANIFSNLTKFAENKVIEMAEKLNDGKIEALPVGNDNFLPCDYCDYWSLCGNYKPSDAKLICKEDSAELLKKIADKPADSKEGDKNG